MSMCVLVTGGAGFIGSHLVDRLLADRAVGRVIVLDDLSTGYSDNLPVDGRLDFVCGSILDRALIEDLTSRVDSVVHLAAVPSVPRSIADPRSSFEANTLGTFNVLEGIRLAGCSASFSIASSSSVYGANPCIPKHEDLVACPVSPYAASKLAAEQMALAYGYSYGLQVLPFRFFNVFGPRQRPGSAYAAVIPAFLEAAALGRPIPMNGTGLQSRDFTYVGSVVEVLAATAIGRVSSPGPVNLAFGNRITLLEVVAEIESVLGRKLEVEHRADRAGDVPHSQADGQRLHNLFPGASPVEFRWALEQTAEWIATFTSGVPASR